jgi:hypothetical protein
MITLPIRPVGEYPGYGVDVEGKVWSLRRGIWRHLKTRPNRGGYPQAYLLCGGKKLTVSVHKLVLLAFIGPCPPWLECRHLDGNKGSPALYDAQGKQRLVWGTHTENCADKSQHGTHHKGSRIAASRLDETDIPVVRQLRAQGVSQRAVARRFNVCQSTIRAIDHGITWAHVA